LADEKTLKEEIQDFYRQGGQYTEKEIDFGKPVGDETLAEC
jgi:antitoxin MazE